LAEGAGFFAKLGMEKDESFSIPKIPQKFRELLLSTPTHLTSRFCLFFLPSLELEGFLASKSRLEPSKSRLGGGKRDFEARLGGKNKNLEVK
jgi:hypothetical protein